MCMCHSCTHIIRNARSTFILNYIYYPLGYCGYYCRRIIVAAVAVVVKSILSATTKISKTKQCNTNVSIHNITTGNEFTFFILPITRVRRHKRIMFSVWTEQKGNCYTLCRAVRLQSRRSSLAEANELLYIHFGFRPSGWKI